VPPTKNALTGPHTKITNFDVPLGVMVTADALHTQRTHATYLVDERGADYLLIVKANQPNLFAQLESLNWDNIPIHTTKNIEHGRDERRTIRVQPAPDASTFPVSHKHF
jgi:predicted transposase YbfD/YdcC